MVISLCGKGAGTLDKEFDAAGIKYKTFERRPGVIYASAGDILTMLVDPATGAIPVVAIAHVLVAWIKSRAGREFTVVTDAENGHKVIRIHARGVSEEEFQNVLRIASRVDAIDPNPPDQSQTPRPPFSEPPL